MGANQKQPVTAVPGGIRQLGYVVENLDNAVQAWSTRMGVGPWTVIRNVPLRMVYRGVSSEPMIDIALSYRGDMQIELIQQTDDVLSPYRSFISERRFGLHHTAFLSEHIHDDVRKAEAAGLKLVCDINTVTGGRYIYFESPVSSEQSFIELIELSPAMRQMFERGIAAAASWDGIVAPTVIDFATMWS